MVLYTCVEFWNNPPWEADSILVGGHMLYTLSVWELTNLITLMVWTPDSLTTLVAFSPVFSYLLGVILASIVNCEYRQWYTV